MNKVFNLQDERTVQLVHFCLSVVDYW